MSISQNDLDSFHHFATDFLMRRIDDLTLEELVQQWRSEREHEETVASVRRGVGDADAGRLRDLGDADAAIRAELGFPPRRQ